MEEEQTLGNERVVSFLAESTPLILRAVSRPASMDDNLKLMTTYLHSIVQRRRIFRQMTGFTFLLAISLFAGCEKKTSSSDSASTLPPAPAPKQQEQKADRYALPARMRGINTQTDHGCPTPDMARQLAQWGVNIVRVNFETDACAQSLPDEKGLPPTDSDPLAPYRQNIALLKSFTQACKEHDIKVVVAADGIYGRRLDYFYKRGGDNFRDGMKKHLLAFWKAFAVEFKDDPSIIAYDVLNEPNYSGNNPDKDKPDVWSKDVFPSALAQIRSVNKDIWVVVMPWPWGLTGGFSNLPYYEDPRMIYSFHNYSPHEYTHQGVQNLKTRGVYTYPGLMPEYDTSPEQYWDRAAYLETLQPVIAFKKKYNVRILVGEFGVIRWAPGREKYIADVIALFEEQGWDWCFHSYGAWNGWNPSFAAEASQDCSPPAPLDGGKHDGVHQILLENWTKNGTAKKAVAQD